MMKSVVVASLILVAGATLAGSVGFAGELKVSGDKILGTQVIAMVEDGAYANTCDLEWDKAVNKIYDHGLFGSARSIRNSLKQSSLAMVKDCRDYYQVSQLCFDLSLELADIDACFE